MHGFANSGTIHTPSDRRIGPTTILALCVLAILGCSESADPLGPPMGGPEDPSEPATVERVLIGPGGKVLGRQPWSWSPKPGEGPGSGEWEEELFTRGPGISSETLARGIVGAAGGPAPLPTSGPLAAPEARGAAGAFFAGGFGPNGAPAGNQAYFYDSATDTWTDFQMAVPRVDHTLTALVGGRFLIVGGNNAIPQPTATAELFDAGTMSLSATGSMAAARWGHAASRLADGRVLVTGGQNGAGTPVLMAEVFDPATGQFTSAGLLAEPRIEHSQVTLDDGRVLIVGGSGRNDGTLWNPLDGSFTPTGDMASIHGVGHTSTLLTDGRVLVLGGDGSTGFLEPTNVAELFDPASGAFAPAGTMNSVRMKHFAVRIRGGRVLIGGGVDATQFPTATAEVFDLTTGTFTPLPNMPAAGEAQAAVFVSGTSQ